ncbi:MAG: aminotransferase [Alphaproteobacteria bacterium]|nr:aminotransferase [Alphaproteobacteria bacterium]
MTIHSAALTNDLPFTANMTDKLWQGDNQHVIHPWEFMQYAGANRRAMIERGSGIYVYDQDGKKLLDGPAGMWCMALGHGRREIAEVMARQAEKLAYYSPFAMASSVAIAFAEELTKHTPGDLNRVFFTNSGSEAVDSAIRFMKFYHNLLGKPHKKKIIAREKGYHGATYLCQGITGRERFRPFMDKADQLAIFISSPHLYFKPAEMSEEDFLQNLIKEMNDTIATHGADNIGAFIAEPIQASGGVIVPPKGYLQAMREICRAHDILYISDEVVTAFGRMGSLFSSSDYFDIVPDIITTAKGITAGYMPMGAFFLSDKIYNRIAGADKTGGQQGAVFASGFTCSGHPVAAAVGLKVLEIFQQEKTMAHVKNIIPYFQRRLRELLDIPIVGDVRGEGLLGCIELVADKKSNKDDNKLLQLDLGVGAMVDNHCYNLGLIVRPIVNLCVMSPPLTITEPEIDFMIDTLKEGVKRTMMDLKKQGAI